MIGEANSEEKKALLKELRTTRTQLLKLPYKSQTDKKIKYIRYADDFIIGINGCKEDCIEIKRKLTEFIAATLKMELSEEKTLITHSNAFARFLGYDIRVRRNNKVKPSGNHTQRTLNNSVELRIPLDDKITNFMFTKGIIKQKDGKLQSSERVKLFRCTELEIVSTFNSELRGLCNYYSLASNFNILNYFSYLMEYSCLKTLAGKRESNIGKIKNKYKDGNGKWGIPYETKSGLKRCYFADYTKCRNSKDASETIYNAELIYSMSRTTFESRLAAKKCELCGIEQGRKYEIHHIHKVKHLKGKKLWEQVMIAKRRKTMVVCEDCHINIHNS